MPDITTAPWSEDDFDCSATRTGARQMDEISRKFQGRSVGGKVPEILTIDEAEEEYNLDIIGVGKTRVVIDVEDDWVTGNTDCIAKLQWDSTYHQNSHEIMIWENANGSQAALLTPILDSAESMNWLIMPKVEGFRGMSAKKAGKIVRGIVEKMRKVGFVTQDVRRANVGVLNGRGVVLDYGSVRYK